MATDSNLRLDQILAAHRHSSHHKKELLVSKKCGCFYCLKNFAYNEINEWIDNNTTALCPECGIDSIIGDASGYPVEPEFLQSMHSYWF